MGGRLTARRLRLVTAYFRRYPDPVPFVMRFWRPLYRACRWLRIDDDDMQSICRLAVCEAALSWLPRHGARFQSYAVAWMRVSLMVAVRRAVRDHRHLGDRKGLDPDTPGPDPGECELERAEREVRVWRAVLALPDDERWAVVRHYGLDGREPLTFRQMAAGGGRSRETWSTRVDRGLAKCRRAMK